MEGKYGVCRTITKKVGNIPLMLVRPSVLIINESGQFLLAQNLNGRWSVPGGLMELGESTEETARREIKEELGINIGRLHLIGVFSGSEFYTQLKNGDEYYSVNIGYMTNEFSGEFKVDGSGIKDAKFFNPTEFPDDMIPELKRQLPRLVNLDIYKKLTKKTT